MSDYPNSVWLLYEDSLRDRPPDSTNVYWKWDLIKVFASRDLAISYIRDILFTLVDDIPDNFRIEEWTVENS